MTTGRETPAASGETPAAKTALNTLEIDESKLSSAYANFCRVLGTPEELIVDFGLNSQPGGAPQTSVAVSQRIVMNHYTAKRLLAALHVALQRHEAVFGPVETDVQKRAAAQQNRPAERPATQR